MCWVQEWRSTASRRGLGAFTGHGGGYGENDLAAGAAGMQYPDADGTGPTGLAIAAPEQAPAPGGQTSSAAAAALAPDAQLAPEQALPEGSYGTAWLSGATRQDGAALGTGLGQPGQPSGAPAAAPEAAEGDSSPAAHKWAGQDAAAWGPNMQNGSTPVQSGSDTDWVSPCNALQGSPTEWMRSGGALEFACAQQVRTLS